MYLAALCRRVSCWLLLLVNGFLAGRAAHLHSLCNTHGGVLALKGRSFRRRHARGRACDRNRTVYDLISYVFIYSKMRGTMNCVTEFPSSLLTMCQLFSTLPIHQYKSKESSYLLVHI